jgi:DNA-directed RNA polymerase specialized sigma24 family protein
MILISFRKYLLHFYRSKLMFCIQNDAYQVDAIGIEYLDGLYSYALVLSHNHADAEDLVQETYVRAMQAMGRLRADSNIKSWFFAILRISGSSS